MSNNIDLDNQSLFKYVLELDQVSKLVSNSKANSIGHLAATQEDIENNKNAEYLKESFTDNKRSSYGSFIWGVFIVLIVGLLILILSSGSCNKHRHDVLYSDSSLSYAPEFGTGFRAMFVRN